jgi:3',5'-cyclic AMP phosphodiesterase CpdA
MSEYRVRILHISDLHARGSRDEHWRRRRVLGEAWDRNLEQLVQDGPFDLLLFTGDAADWGLREEYNHATEFLQAVRQRLHIGLDRLFVIPGNHDVERKKHEDVWKRMRMAVRSGADVLALGRWMAGKSRSAPLGFESGWNEQILERQAEYRRWVSEDLARPELAVPLAYRQSLNLPRIPFPVHLMGVNTAWLCGDDADPKNLLLTDTQLMDAAVGDDGNKLPGLRLLLMHHPFDELADGAECRRLAADHVDLILRGHLHVTEVDTWADPDRRLRQLAAGCLYEGYGGDRYANACHAITLTLDSQGALLKADLRFRSWSPRGRWFDDDGLYKGSRQGRLTWHFERRTAEPRRNPYYPWDPHPETFVGRNDMLRRLEEALHTNRSFSVVADWRMGKSMLLAAWFQRVGELGRVAVLLSGEGPEGRSVARFVQKITGLASEEDPDKAADLLSMWAEGEARRGGPPVIMLDETDSVVRVFGYRFFERLRGMLGRVVLVFASRRPLDLLFEEIGTGSPLSNRLEIAWLGLLEESAAEQLIALGASDHAPAMRRWAGRHPFFLQVLGHYLVQSGELESAMESARTQACARIREWLRILSVRERKDLDRAVNGEVVLRRSLRERGLLTAEGRPFGEVLVECIREEL